MSVRQFTLQITTVQQTQFVTTNLFDRYTHKTHCHNGWRSYTLTTRCYWDGTVDAGLLNLCSRPHIIYRDGLTLRPVTNKYRHF